MAKQYTYNDGFEIAKGIQRFKNKCIESLQEYTRVKHVTDNFKKLIKSPTPVLAFNNSTEAEKLQSVQNIVNYRKKLIMETSNYLTWIKRDYDSPAQVSGVMFYIIAKHAKDHLNVDLSFPEVGSVYDPRIMKMNEPNNSINKPIVEDFTSPAIYDYLQGGALVVPAVVEVREAANQKEINKFNEFQKGL